MQKMQYCARYTICNIIRKSSFNILTLFFKLTLFLILQSKFVKLHALTKNYSL